MRKSPQEAPPKQQQPSGLHDDFPAGIRIRKLRLALWIMGVGMMIALMWHGFQGWALGNGYPYNTFLFIPEDRFSDFGAPTHMAALPSPYDPDQPDAGFPADFAFFFRFFSFFSPLVGLLIFLGVGLAGILLVLIYALYPIALEQVLMNAERARPSHPSHKQMKGNLEPAGVSLTLRAGFPSVFVWSAIFSGALLGFSYPIWIEIDRANNEIYLALFMALSLLFISRGYYAWGLTWLLPAIFYKLYPAALLVLYLRRGKLRWILVAFVAFFLISWISLGTFSHTISENIHLWERDAALTRTNYIIGNWGMGGSATPWNACKFIILVFDGFGADSAKSWDELRNDLRPTYESALTAFNASCLLGAVTVTLYTYFVEKEFLRRAVVILLFLVMAGPLGGDYKLLHVETALVAFLLVSTRRRFDFLVVALLAFALIPKKEMLLLAAGHTDSGYFDVPVGIVLNPLSMLGAATLLTWDGIAQWEPGWSVKRFQCLISSFRIPSF